jgi:hypothetical protein
MTIPRWWIVPALAAAVAGFWMWRTDDPVQVLAALGLAVTTPVVTFWRSRVQAGRRLRTALDDYADRALARERRRKGPKSSPARVA